MISECSVLRYTLQIYQYKWKFTCSIILAALLSKMNLVDAPPDELEEYFEEERNREKEQLRDLIERLVNDILGENVDDASINKIYDDKNCK